MSLHSCPSHSGLSPPGCPCPPAPGWAVKEQLLWSPRWRGHRVCWGHKKVGSSQCLPRWACPKCPSAVTHLRPLAPALALISEAGGKVRDPKLPELAGGCLWRSPDPAPREIQCEWVAGALSSPELAAMSQERTGASQPRGGGCHWGCAPQQRLQCTGRADALGQLSHGDTESVLNLQLLCTGTRAECQRLCCLSHFLAPKAADFPAGAPRQQQSTHCVSWLCTAPADAAADHPQCPVPPEQCQQSTGSKQAVGKQLRWGSE